MMMDIDAMIKFLQQAKEDGAHSVIVSDMCDDHCHERVFCLVLPKGRHIAVINLLQKILMM